MLLGSSRRKEDRIVLTWENLSYEIAKKSTTATNGYEVKKILTNVNGRAESGQLLAILGPTGCGKTSLLNALSSRIATANSKYSRFTGTIKANGRIRNEDHFRDISAYVLQDDNMYAFLTVHETLLLAAHFFISSKKTVQELHDVVDAVINLLGLGKVRDTIIGNDANRGVSGGERKRVSIGVQLLTDPAVLFLDEPTSGLDAFQALAVMKAIKGMAMTGRLVITVIHQPRSSIFDIFDRLLILSEGRTMFCGDAHQAIEYFAAAGHRCPDNFNPADYFLDILSPDHRNAESSEATRNRISYLGKRWSDQLSRNSSANDLSNKISEDAAVAEQFEDLAAIKRVGNIYDFRKMISALGLLSWRTWVQNTRDIRNLRMRLVFSLFFSLVIGYLYSNTDNSQSGIRNRIGALFFIIINQSFVVLFSVVSVFPSEKVIVNRERSGRAYPTIAYFLAKVVVEMPMYIFPAVIYGLIVHPLVHFNDNTFGEFIGIISLQILCAASLGLLVSAISPSLEAANILAPIFLIIAILYGGFYISLDSLPVVLNLVPYLSCFRWSFQALMINEFTGLTFKCDSGGMSPCFQNGEEVLKSWSFDGRSTSYAVFGLAMLTLAFLFFTYLILDHAVESYITLGHKGSNFPASLIDNGAKNDEISNKGIEISQIVDSKNQEFNNYHNIDNLNHKNDKTSDDEVCLSSTQPSKNSYNGMDDTIVVDIVNSNATHDSTNGVVNV